MDHEDAIAPDPNDQLHVILRDLGPSPSVESLLGGVREPAPGEDKADVITEAGKQELPLTLTNKFEGLAEDDSSNMKALFVRQVGSCTQNTYMKTNVIHVQMHMPHPQRSKCELWPKLLLK